EQLWSNLVHWAVAHAFRRAASRPAADAVETEHWRTPKREGDALRLQQRSDGSRDLAEHDAAALRARVDAIAAAVQGLAPRFPHQDAYLEAAVADLRAWADGGFGVPDFGASLERFRPDLVRRDGVQHLVLFPMYKQNG